MGGREPILAVEVTDGAQNSHLGTGAGQYAGNKPGGRGFAIGPGNAYHLQLPAGVTGQGLADPSIGLPRIGHDATRKSLCVDRHLNDEPGGAPRDGIGGELMTIAGRTGQGHEDIAWLNAATVAGVALDQQVVGAEEFGFR